MSLDRSFCCSLVMIEPANTKPPFGKVDVKRAEWQSLRNDASRDGAPNHEKDGGETVE